MYQKEADDVGFDFRLPNELVNKFNIEKVISHKASNMYNGSVVFRTSNGEVRNRTISVDFKEVASICGWTGGGTIYY